MKYAGLSIILVLVFIAGGLSLDNAPPAEPVIVKGPEPMPVPTPVAPSGGALISFSSQPVRFLDPSGGEKVELSWHAVAKGDFGACVVTAATFFSNADGSVTRSVDWAEAQPNLPHVLKGRAGGGVIKLDTEQAILKAIKMVADLPESEGVDRLVVVLTVTGTKGGAITTQDADVVTFLPAP